MVFDYTYISEHELRLLEVKLPCSEPPEVEVVSVIWLVRDVLHSLLESHQSSLLLRTQVTHVSTHATPARKGRIKGSRVCYLGGGGADY